MRPIERIDDFLSKVDWDKLYYERWKINPDDLPRVHKSELDNMVHYWKKNYDQRVGQVLINLGLIPDSLFAWNDEEPNILISQGFDPAECYYWGNNYDKDMNRLPKTIYKPIRELSTEHILSIIDGGFIIFNRLYSGIMEEELRRREVEEF